jgi:hypothetical protein
MIDRSGSVGFDGAHEVGDDFVDALSMRVLSVEVRSIERLERSPLRAGSTQTARFYLGVWALVTAALLAALCACGALPGLARADATIAPEAAFSAAPGLPDGRVYEQVSPADKNGNVAEYFGEGLGYSVAAADGEAVLFSGSGPMGTSVSGDDRSFVARRSAGGWSTTSALPRVKEALGFFVAGVKTLLPSADLSHMAFTSGGPYVTAPAPGDPRESANLYLAGSDPFAEPAWLAQPTIADPFPALGKDANSQDFSFAGAAADLSTVYFTYPGTLLAADVPRDPYVDPEGILQFSAAGFYESKDGVLSSAAELPDGSVSPFGALPAAELETGGAGDETTPDDFDNEVSTDGSRAFFVSPDPGKSLSACNPSDAGSGGCVPQLYVRESEGEGASERRKTVLVSQDTLLPAVAGLPAPAPDGPLTVRHLHVERGSGGSTPKPYVYASPDGSQAFFESADALTNDAPEDGFPKEYDFDTHTNTLTYMPGVTDGLGGTATVLASAQDGSSLLFAQRENPSPQEEAEQKVGRVTQLDLYSSGTEGSGGGTVRTITALPASEISEEGKVYVPSARATADGSVFVFSTNSPLPGGFNNADSQQVYRYQVSGNSLSCISCPPAGVTPSDEANLANGDNGNARIGVQGTLIGTRAISADGSRVYFDTPDALVPQDTDGVVDVYEWENGAVYLISSGTSARASFLLDNSESGDDLFFATADGLVPGDTDGAYDVYDARVPRPGDSQPPAEVPCAGDVCQGPPRVPAPLGAPASATFSGPGNPAPSPAVTPSPTKKTTTKTVRCKKGFVKKRNKCVKVKKAKKAGHNGRAK